MATNYKSHQVKLYADSDQHYLFLRDGKDTVSGFGLNQPVHEMRYTDVATGLENQPIMIRGLHVDVGGQTSGVGYKLGDLDSRLSTEVSAREDAVSGLQSDLSDLSSTVDANKSSSDSALATLTSDLTSLNELVVSNNSSASSAVSAEQSRAESAEGALSARITYLENVINELLNM